MSERGSTLVLVAVLFGLLLATLGSRADWAADEHLYLAGGQVMVEGGSLLVPAYHTGQPRFMKPPLFYWLVWLSMLALGTGLAAARLPALLSGLVVLYFTWRLASEGGRRPREGAMAAAALGGSYLFLYHSRAAVTDMTMTAGIVAGLGFLIEHLCGRQGIAALYAAAAALGMSCMAKGPVALVLAFGAAALFLLLPGRPRLQNLRFSLHWLGALSVLGAVGFWWYAAMWLTQGSGFLQHQVDAEVVARTQSSFAGRLGNLAWYAGRSLTAGLPWTLAAAWGMASGARPPASAARRLAWCACLAIVVFYGVAINWRASRYLVPLEPFAAVIVGGYLGAADARSRRGGAVGVLRVLTAALSGLAVMLLAFFWAAARGGLSARQQAVLAVACALAAVAFMLLARGRMSSLRTVLVSSAALALIFTVPNLLVKGVVRKDPMHAIADASHSFPPGLVVSDAGLTNRESAILFVFGKRDAVRLGGKALDSDAVVVKGEQPPPDAFEVLGTFEGPVRRVIPAGLAGSLLEILAQGNLLGRLPRTSYYLARPMSAVTAEEGPENLGSGEVDAPVPPPPKGEHP